MDDLISRKAAIDVLSMMQGIVTENGVRKGISMAWQQIKDLPSTESERKEGEWVHLGGSDWCCSACGYVICTEGSWEHPLERGCRYCEQCGAKLRKEDGG